MDTEEIIYLIGIFAWVLYNTFKKRAEKKKSENEESEKEITPQYEYPEQKTVWETIPRQEGDDKKTMIPENPLTENEKMSETNYKDELQEKYEENKNLETIDHPIMNDHDVVISSDEKELAENAE